MMNTGRSGGRDGFLKRHHVAFVLPYQAVAIPVVLVTTFASPFRSGPCTPNLDVFAYLLDSIVTIVMLGISTIKLIFKGRPHLLAFVINAIALGILILLNFVRR